MHSSEQHVILEELVKLLCVLIAGSTVMQLQDAGCWTDAATLAATHLKGSDYARSLIL